MPAHLLLVHPHSLPPLLLCAWHYRASRWFSQVRSRCLSTWEFFWPFAGLYRWAQEEGKVGLRIEAIPLSVASLVGVVIYPSNFQVPGGFLAPYTGEDCTCELQSLVRKTWPVKVAAPQISVEIRGQQSRSLEAHGAFLPFILWLSNAWSRFSEHEILFPKLLNLLSRSLLKCSVSKAVTSFGCVEVLARDERWNAIFLGIGGIGSVRAYALRGKLIIACDKKTVSWCPI